MRVAQNGVATLHSATPRLHHAHGSNEEARPKGEAEPRIPYALLGEGA
jgi:hypothetical protein